EFGHRSRDFHGYLIAHASAAGLGGELPAAFRIFDDLAFHEAPGDGQRLGVAVEIEHVAERQHDAAAKLYARVPSVGRQHIHVFDFREQTRIRGEIDHHRIRCSRLDAGHEYALADGNKRLRRHALTIAD